MATPAHVASSAWLRDQWHNPSDIFTILLIIGGEVVQIAIAQLCAGPISYLAPVTFSFGWVSYAVSTALRAVGDNRLMPKPELDCIVINAKSGYRRPNRSWVLSRLLRDFDDWKPRACDEVEVAKLRALRDANAAAWKEHESAKAHGAKSQEPADYGDVRVGLRVTVWDCMKADGRGSGDMAYWSGLLVSAAQISIAVVPWAVEGEWCTFVVTAAGTILAYLSGALPQWQQEKVGVRSLKCTNKKRESKNIFLTEGNGAHDVVLILGCEGGMDLEALAVAQRDLTHPWITRAASFTLASLWLALLISVAGWGEDTWYLLGIGLVGLVHNVMVAGMKRQPCAWGINLHYVDTIVDEKVMDVLLLVETAYPSMGRALLDEFFPGRLFPREQTIWEYAGRRSEAWSTERKGLRGSAKQFHWQMPPRRRACDSQVDDDIPPRGPYQSTGNGLAANRACLD